MANTVVVYCSNYGHCKRYAKWISEELGCDIFEKKAIKAAQLKQYDTIIFGGGVYAGTINGIDFVSKNYDKLYDKNWVIFSVGLTDPTLEENVFAIKQWIEKTFTARMKENIKFFHLRGGIDYSEMGFIHMSIMAMLHKMLVEKDYLSLSDGEKTIIESFGKTVDYLDKESLSGLFEHLKNK